MKKELIINSMEKHSNLLLNNPYFYNLFTSLNFYEFDEEDLVEFIAMCCEKMDKDNKELIEYIKRYGFIEK